MRIIVASAQFPPSQSGFARVAGRLAQEFEAAGHSVALVTESRGCARIGRAHRLNREGHRILEEGADVVQVIGPSPLFTEQVAAESARLGIRCVYKADAFPGLSSHYAGPLPKLIDRVYQSTLLRRAMRSVDYGVYSTSDFARVASPRPARWAVIPLGVDDPCIGGPPIPLRPARASTDPLRVLFVGQLRPYKGVTLLLEAARLALRSATPLRVTIVGGGPQREELEAKGADLRAEGHLRFLGPLDDERLHDEYLTNDVLVLPSLQSESYGLVLLEAALHEMKIISSDLPGVREVVREVGGTLVPRGDVSAIAAALQTCARAGPASRGVDRVLAERHSWKSIADAYLRLYRSVLDGGVTTHGLTGSIGPR